MAKKSKSISDKRVNTLLRRINKIRSNYKQNLSYLKKEYEKMFGKSIYFQKTKLNEDPEAFDIQYEIIMQDPKKIKTNKQIRKQAERFVEHYKSIGQFKIKTIEKRFVLYMRDEWVSNFRDLGLDEKLIRKLQRKGLWENARFWGSFFNSKYYIPLYHRYTREEIENIMSGVIKGKHTIWGKYLGEYLNEWENKRE